MKVYLETILDAGNMASTTLTSSAVELQHYILCGLQAVYTGSPVGTLSLQASLDQTTWTDIAGATAAVAAAGSSLFNVSDLTYPYMRLVYTKTSGTGSLTVKSFSKGF